MYKFIAGNSCARSGICSRGARSSGISGQGSAASLYKKVDHLVSAIVQCQKHIQRTPDASGCNLEICQDGPGLLLVRKGARPKTTAG